MLFANRRAETMLAVEGGLRGRSPLDFYVDPSDRERVLAAVRADGSVSDVEVQFRGGDGRQIWALLSAGQVDFDGRPAMMVAFNDITARRAMEDELRRAKDVAEEAMAARSRYLAVMSHEIRTPVAGMKGLTELMLAENQSSLSADLRENLELMDEAAESIVALVSELLDWSQLEAGSVCVETVSVVLGDFLRPLVGLFRPAAEAKGVDLRLVVDPGVPPAVETDPLRLRQILSNLLANAVKFTEQGEVGVEVRAQPDGAPDHWRLEFVVWDTGLGIDPAAQARLFRPYAQADASVARRFGGSGLGLSISQALARLLGGGIMLESAVGAGSTFRVHIRAIGRAGPV